jgi:hypothetical protein
MFQESIAKKPDFELIKSWLRMCEEIHPECFLDTQRSIVRNMRVVDVKTRLVIAYDGSERPD